MLVFNGSDVLPDSNNNNNIVRCQVYDAVDDFSAKREIFVQRESCGIFGLNPNHNQTRNP